jgi:hypothetical protein
MVCSEPDPARALGLLDESQRAAEAAANTFALIAATSVRSSLLTRAGEHQAAAAAFLAVAHEAYRYGRREQQAIGLVGFAGSLAAQRQAEPAAVALGWAESLLGPVDTIAGFSNRLDDWWRSLVRLPEELGDKYASLHGQGAAMTAEEILEYAHDQMNAATDSRT